MNCDQARPHLSALAHGALGTALAEEVSEHLTTCAVCRTRVETLRAELIEQSEHENKTDTWTSKLRVIPRRILGPQVSMAMVLLLMVGIGLLYLPRLRQTGDLGGSPLVDTGNALGRNGAILPAAPLDLALDPRAHRIRTREEEEALAAAAAIAARALASRDAGLGDGALGTSDAEVEDASVDLGATAAIEIAAVPSTNDGVVPGAPAPVHPDPAVDGVTLQNEPSAPATPGVTP